MKRFNYKIELDDGRVIDYAVEATDVATVRDMIDRISRGSDYVVLNNSYEAYLSVRYRRSSGSL